ncbi:hypothetical protein ACJX0J_003453 [Zea mays]
MLSIACVDQFLVAFSLVDSYFIVWRNNFFYYNIILNQTDMYISKRFSSEVKSTKVTQKMDKIVSVTNKNIYRESLLTSSKLEKMPRDWHFHLIIIYIFEIFCFFYFLEKKNEYQAWINYTENPGFKEKRYGLDCIEDSMEANYCESISNQILSTQILQFIWINADEDKERCDKNSMNLMLFIK